MYNICVKLVRDYVRRLRPKINFGARIVRQVYKKTIPYATGGGIIILLREVRSRPSVRVRTGFSFCAVRDREDG